MYFLGSIDFSNLPPPVEFNGDDINTVNLEEKNDYNAPDDFPSFESVSTSPIPDYEPTVPYEETSEIDFKPNDLTSSSGGKPTNRTQIKKGKYKNKKRKQKNQSFEEEYEYTKSSNY